MSSGLPYRRPTIPPSAKSGTERAAENARTGSAELLLTTAILRPDATVAPMLAATPGSAPPSAPPPFPGWSGCALDVQLGAEELAPEQVRYHAISWQLVLSRLRNIRGSRSVPLELLAGRHSLARASALRLDG